MKTKMHLGASNRIFSNAKALRNRQTFAEKLLWSRIRNNQLGYHFRRQHPILNYILDFYCKKIDLVIELDGSIHSDKIVIIADQIRQKNLESYGLHVIRFANDEVIKNVDDVVISIKSIISEIEGKSPLQGI